MELVEDRDELVGVAYANDRVEAEMIQGLLEPSSRKRWSRAKGWSGVRSAIPRTWKTQEGGSPATTT